MFRLLVGALAAFVGFSLGNGIPKWLENRGNRAEEISTPADMQPLMRRKPPRRRSYRKCKVGISRFVKKFSSVDMHSEPCLERDAGDGQCFAGGSIRLFHGKFREDEPGEKAVNRRSSIDDGFQFDHRKGNQFWPSADVKCGMSVEKGRKKIQQQSVAGPQKSFTAKNEQPRPTAQADWKSRETVGRLDEQKKSDEKGKALREDVVDQRNAQVEVVQVRQKLQVQEWKCKLNNLKNKALANEKVWGTVKEEFQEEGTLEKQREGKRTAQVAKWATCSEEDSDKQLLTRNTELMKFGKGGKGRGHLREDEWQRTLHEKEQLRGAFLGKDCKTRWEEGPQLRRAVEQAERKEFKLVKDRIREDTAKLEVRYALLEGRKTDLERY